MKKRLKKMKFLLSIQTKKLSVYNKLITLTLLTILISNEKLQIITKQINDKIYLLCIKFLITKAIKQTCTFLKTNV